ncbi:hypothetical protein M758_UG008900 [Ceratodon purpureus]|nr:hypothetical protein M758_UG008900 [Ceratodon purpureus]
MIVIPTSCCCPIRSFGFDLSLLLGGLGRLLLLKDEALCDRTGCSYNCCLMEVGDELYNLLRFSIW